MSTKGQEDPSHLSRIVTPLVQACKPVNYQNLTLATNSLLDNKLSIDCYNSELTHTNCTLRQYSDLFESAPIGYLMVDEFFHIVKINRSASELLEINQEVGTTALFPLSTSVEENDALKNLIKLVANGTHAKVSLHTTLNRSTTVSYTHLTLPTILLV